MNKLYVVLFCGFLSLTANSQELSVDELLTLTSLSQQKFDNYISKKGFSKSRSTGFQHDSIEQTYKPKSKTRSGSRKKKEPEVARWVQKMQDSKFQSLLFLTSSAVEHEEIREDLRKEGFACDDSLDLKASPTYFRRKNVTVQVSTVVENNDTLYSFRFREKLPPPPVKISFADDLVQFSSHDHLVAIFGEANVRKDQYFFTDKDIKRCSVLFPNTERQAVFIWENDSTLEELSSIVIGGSLRVSSAMNYVAQVAQNTWELSNGMRCNMNLRELLAMNEMDFQFFGKESEFFLTVVPQNTGAIDLKGLTVMLGCLNCENAGILNARTVSAKDALRYGLGVYIIMIMISADSVKPVTTPAR